MAVVAETPIPTPKGWVVASELRAGDFVFNPRGGLQQVGAVQAYIPGECYTAHFDDGLQVTGDKHLSFALQDKTWRSHQDQWFKNQSSKFAKKKFRRPLKVRPLGELYREPLVDARNRKRWSLKSTEPLEYPHVDLPVPPYILGLWLGSITSGGKHYIGGRDFQKMQKMVRRFGFNLVRTHTKEPEFSFRPSVRESFTFAHAPIPDIIPQSYLEADVESRMLLLEGLMDARNLKKSRTKRDTLFVYDNWRSVRRKQQLLEGLGYVTKLDKKLKMTTFLLEATKNATNCEKTRRFLTQIEKITTKQCIHIAVDGEFVVGEGFLAVC